MVLARMLGVIKKDFSVTIPSSSLPDYNFGCFFKHIYMNNIRY